MKYDRQTIILWALLLFVIVLIYHPWFGTKMIARGDWKALSSDWILDYLGTPSIWDEADLGGIAAQHSGLGLARYPLFYLQALSYKYLGLDFAWTERILWFFPFLISSVISIYLLSKYLFAHRLVSFFTTIYFVSNNFILFRLHGAQMFLAIGYALAPLSIYLFIRSFKEEKLIFSLLNAAVLSLVSYNDVRIVVLVILLEVAYGLYYSLVLAPKRSGSVLLFLKTLAVSGIFVLLLNIFWLLPLLYDLQASLPSEPGFSSGEVLRSLSRTDFLNALALSIGADSKKGGFIYLDGQIISYALFPILLLIYGASLWAKPRRDYLFWLVAAAIFAFFAKGLNPPLSFINAAFYKYVPLSSMYRLPSKFLLIGATPISLCFGLGCVGALSRIRHSRWQTPALWCLAALPILVIFPALFGSKSLRAMRGGSSFNPLVSSGHLRFGEWLNRQDNNYKTLFLPGSPSYYSFSTKHPQYKPLAAQQHKTSFGAYFDYRLKTFQGLKAPDDRVLLPLLRLVNVGYIFLAPSDDTSWDWFRRGAYNLLRNALLGIGELERGGDGNTFIIKNPAPRFYISKHLVHIDGDFAQIIKGLLDSEVDLQTLTLVDKRTSDSVSPQKISAAVLSGNLPEVKVKKAGNASYRIKINNPPEGKFYLNFQDNFDPNWRLDGQIKPHLSAMGTSYFPLVNEEGKSFLEFTLVHRLQKYLDFGWRVSQLSWFLVILGLVGSRLRKR